MFLVGKILGNLAEFNGAFFGRVSGRGLVECRSSLLEEEQQTNSFDCFYWLSRGPYLSKLAPKLQVKLTGRLSSCLSGAFERDRASFCEFCN